MKVIEHLEKAKGAQKPLISFEVIPPKRGGDITQLFNVIGDVMKYEPPFIDVTSRAAEVEYRETPQGIQKKVIRKRPGTIGISVAIKNHFNIDTVPHILCLGFTREETEDALIELNYLGIENILAIRGDDLGYHKPIPEYKSQNRFAYELIQQVNNMNCGRYLEEDLLDAKPTKFCIGVSGYPEKHFEAPNMKVEVDHVKQKISSGGDYVVTQMFYDNKVYFDFVNRCREAGIEAPIIPGLKVLTAKSHLFNIPKNFYINIPEELSGEILEAKDEHVMEIGAKWTAKQAEELLNNGAPSLHFYIMQSAKPINKMFGHLKM
ncbi:MAG TPA: methylenetetrahydrofolate reductase [Ignavibacteria bacterium]|nr:methylenetetrahydrofolate reductase [Ignavibacteria bacterium]HAX50154.1 methylenetetrahydrofolate reductase [NAD(P)H] [Bacteroidota bacterium]HRE12141.1 methylenetetrahydrofolate reductase [Ignavibacteria bacterium]HRF64639.1 methylenetetrahydrofolate reductase [Ignavibacteria bacterium]HRJ04968.1 methylenetetrahydrofolate reductase [Ignavibacteria bacterium]